MGRVVRSGRPQAVAAAGNFLGDPVAQMPNRVDQALIAHAVRIAGKQIGSGIDGLGRHQAAPARQTIEIPLPADGPAPAPTPATAPIPRPVPPPAWRGLRWRSSSARPSDRALRAAANRSTRSKPTGKAAVTLTTTARARITPASDPHASAGRECRLAGGCVGHQQPKADKQQIKLQHADLAPLQAVQRRQRGGDRGRPRQPVGRSSLRQRHDRPAAHPGQPIDQQRRLAITSPQQQQTDEKPNRDLPLRDRASPAERPGSQTAADTNIPSRVRWSPRTDRGRQNRRRRPRCKR